MVKLVEVKCKYRVCSCGFMVEIMCIKGEKVGVNKEISGGNEVVHTIFPTCSTPPIVTCSTRVKAFHLYNKMFRVFHQSITCSTP